MRTQNNPLQKLANIKHKLQSIRANMKYKFPYKKLKIIGVTGSEGKTTVIMLIYHILKQNGLKAAYTSTIKGQIGSRPLEMGLHVTTPEPWDMPKYLSMMVEQGIEYAVIESTSQGLEQNRLWGIKYDAVAITNIKSDHLDYHGTWENYARAKYQIIQKLGERGLAVLNKDDKNGYDWLKQNVDELNDNGKLDVTWVSKSDVTDYKYDINGLRFKYKGVSFTVPLLGEYNLENALMAINICNKYLRLPNIAKAIASFQTPTGRMEVVQKSPFTAIIDFAHTPNALHNALNSLTPLKNSSTKIITVFGCAGKRDKKRREMGKVAAELADIIILTAEDPRNEKLFDINTDIVNYARQYKGDLIIRFADTTEYRSTNINTIKEKITSAFDEGKKPIIAFDEDAIASRVDALDLAAKLAGKDDILFATGKSHEASLCFGEKEYSWNEHKYLKRALKNLKAGK